MFTRNSSAESMTDAMALGEPVRYRAPMVG